MFVWFNVRQHGNGYLDVSHQRTLTRGEGFASSDVKCAYTLVIYLSEELSYKNNARQNIAFLSERLGQLPVLMVSSDQVGSPYAYMATCCQTYYEQIPSTTDCRTLYRGRSLRRHG
jgi:hypothetical protein